jgi:membrane-associated phospholipid phosphatase
VIHKIQPHLPREGYYIKPFIFFTIYFAIFYGTSSRFHVVTPTVMAPSDVDRLFPLMPLTILIYVSQFLMLPLSMFLANSNLQRARAYIAMLMAIGFSAAVFLCYPTRLPRDLDAVQSTDLSYVWNFLYVLDTDSNCLPSLHVSLAFLAVWAVSRSSLRVRGLMFFWAVAISVSTMTTKQHLFLDVIGGTIMALFTAVVATYLIPEREHATIVEPAA